MEVCEASTSKSDDNSRLTEIQRIDKILEENISKNISMLPFEKQIFIDCVYSDGTMIVVAKGISYDRVLLNLFEAYVDPSNLILVLNCDDNEEKYLTKLLNSPHIHQASNNSNEREKVYLAGGIQFISTQILVLDFLKNKIPAELITGIFVLRAHKVIESCQEAFALRLYRQKNKTGFIKAFTASPESFMYGFNQMEKVMRNLFVADLFIWPRFHARIQKDFKPNEPLSVEFSIPLSPKMDIIQKCLLELMNFLVEELKRINPYLELEEVTVENCGTKKFNKILEAQLDHVWHQLNPKTKLLITDLKILRNLMFSAVYNDAVSFYAYLRKYRTAEYAKNNSGWTLSDNAEKVFVLSKERVYNKKDEFEPEYPPKLKALTELLCTEIPSHIKKMAEDKESEFDKDKPIRILILCNDAKTAHQLNQYLTQGLERTLFWTALRNEVSVQKLSSQYKNIPMGGSGNVNQAVCVNQVNLKGEKSKEKAVPETSAKINLKMKESKKTTKESEEEIERELLLAEAIFNDEEQADFCNSYTLTMTQRVDNEERLCAVDFDSSLTESFKFDPLDESKQKDYSMRPAVSIQTFRSDENRASSLALTLEEMQPNYVIMYNMNIAAIRQIETFEARMQRPAKKRLIGYVLIHGKTVEEQGFLTGIRREKKAFEHLIQAKKTMIVPEYQLGKRDVDEIVKRRIKEVSNRNAEEKEPEKLLVIVDSREFRSELPSLLHRRGFEIVPAMITIGDYILTPQICVERKSISDLIGSLQSGRLFNQTQNMSRHYPSVVLLIEFDQNRPFHLLGRYVVSREYEMSSTELIQKLQILTIHFPRLRIIWSPSPYATAQIFEDLKKNKENPQIEVVSQIGTEDGGNSEASEKYNNEIYDFLLKLPGVNSKNIHNLMKKGKSLKNLVTLKENELTSILGNSKDAKMLYDVLHNVIKPGNNQEKQRKAPSLAQRYFRKM